jgi:predicted DNA-binding transcriptional regulator AlpA
MTRLISEAEARAKLGNISSGEFYRGIRAGRYPVAAKIGVQEIRWNVDEIDVCVRQRLEAPPPGRLVHPPQPSPTRVKIARTHRTRES